MRRTLLLALAVPALALASAAAAQDAPAPAPSAEPDAAALRNALSAAQGEIARLRVQTANQQEAERSLAEVRARNLRLVAIANELIAAYQERYRRGHFLPFDSGRRKFETELQAVGDRVYDNRWDAGPRRAPPPGAAPAAAGDPPPADPPLADPANPPAPSSNTLANPVPDAR